MKKNEKIMIGILILILVIMCAILFLNKTSQKQNIATNVEKQDNQENLEAKNKDKELGRIIMVEDKLYYDTGKESDYKLRCGVMDGKITSNIEKDKIPTQNNQANFEGDYSYQYGIENTIEMRIDDKWIVFEAKETDEFKIKIYDKSIESNKKIKTIIDKNENNKYDYNIYGYGVNVNIIINGEEISLKQALEENKITMEKIIEKADRDLPNALVYKDGGTKEYHYDLYTIIKRNTLDGNKDVYIGMPDINLNTILQND